MSELPLLAPFTAYIGAELEERSEGYVRLGLTLEARHMNPVGVMHGGVVTTLMDSAVGAALGTVRGDEARRRDPHATVDMNASFLSGARPGDRLVVEGRVVRVGRSIAFGEAEARRDGKVVAMGRLTFAIRNRG